MKIQIDRRSLLAVSRFAATQDVRYYLIGVNVEATATSTTLIATDGSRLAAVRRDAGNDIVAGETVSVILPLDLVKRYKRVTKANADKPLEIERVSDTLWQITDSTEAERRSFTPIDGRFPDWRHVVPRTPSAEPARYNPLSIADYGRAAEDLGDVASAINIAPNGEGAALVTLVGREEFVGALMPQRGGVPETAAPAWLDEAAALA